MDGLRAVNVYVTETPTGLVLIDGGWAIPESRSQFESSMKEAGYAISDIRQFLVTHMHRDHYTQAYVLGQEVGADVSLGMGDRATLEFMHDTTVTEDPNLARLVQAGASELAGKWHDVMPAERPDMSDYGMPDTWLDGDQVIDLGARQLAAVSTPGHTQGHFVFADIEGGLLFAGDHVLPTITPSIGFEPVWVEQPLRDFMESLRKVRTLPDLQVLPAHGPTGMSSHQRVDELLKHHEDRLDACKVAVAGGATTAWEVTGELPWTRRNRKRDELGPFDVILAAFETLAHLELLALRGDLSRTEVEGEIHFA
jgi:glyoxylase-like metal-dependent hydrolase (beta-lactamase superfamily II)